MKGITENWSQFLSLIYERNPMQKKMIESFLSSQESVYWERAEDFASKLCEHIKAKNLSVEYVVGAYLKMCSDMIAEQFRFKKTGRYLSDNASDANSRIYSSESEMSSYMYGLALSQFLWPNHYAMYNFFRHQSSQLTGIKNYLEIGPGHGLFLVEALKLFSGAKFSAVDVSPVSIDIARDIVEHFLPNSQCKFMVQDATELKQGSYDYIVMCEVLEHLDCPLTMLKSISNLLSTQGSLFITTCANCPTVDHVYLYESVEQIRHHVREAGFTIVTDLPLPVGDYPEEEWQREKIVVNYAALLHK